MQLYKEGVYNAVDKSNGEERRGVYYLYFLSSQSYILPIAFFFPFNSFIWISLECSEQNFDRYVLL